MHRVDASSYARFSFEMQVIARMVVATPAGWQTVGCKPHSPGQAADKPPANCREAQQKVNATWPRKGCEPKCTR